MSRRAAAFNCTWGKTQSSVGAGRPVPGWVFSTDPVKQGLKLSSHSAGRARPLTQGCMHPKERAPYLQHRVDDHDEARLSVEWDGRGHKGGRFLQEGKGDIVWHIINEGVGCQLPSGPMTKLSLIIIIIISQQIQSLLYSRHCSNNFLHVCTLI